MSRRLPPRRFHHTLKAGLPVRRAPHPQPPPGPTASAGTTLTYAARLPPGITLGPPPTPAAVTVTYAAGGIPPGVTFQ